MSDIDLLADAREWLATQGDRIQTHGELCHRWHPACLVSRLLSRSGQPEAKTRDFDADVPARDNAAPATIACDRGRTDNAVDRPAGTGDTPTLTDAEREAVQWAIVAADLEQTETAGEFSAFVAERAATLRSLLARTSACGNRQ